MIYDPTLAYPLTDLFVNIIGLAGLIGLLILMCVRQS